MKISPKLSLAIPMLALVLQSNGFPYDKALWRCSINSERWVEKPAPGIVPTATHDNRIDIKEQTVLQEIDGFGGCFNEWGWDALSALDESARQNVLKALFDPDTGTRFNICRMPIGSSDYAMDYYSLDDNEGDFAMEHFSIERDKLRLLPFIKGAMKYNPDLKVWGSPWSPPKWMKVNNNYTGAEMIWTPQNLDAYALYLAKAARAYQAEGLHFYMVSFQNEPYAGQIYPSCLWSGTQMRDFVKTYLGPRFKKDSIQCDLWLPTMNNGNYQDCIAPTFDDPVATAYIKGVGFQWAGEGAIADVYQKYPGKKLMCTETKCGAGENDWGYAEFTFDQFLHYLSNGANGYMQWNIVLDQTGKSWWGWTQCAMITVDKNSKQVTYNPQHHLAKHFSYYITPGAHRVESVGNYGDQLAFKNPNGDLVVVVKNGSFDNVSLAITFGSQMITPTIPGKSFNTFVISSAPVEKPQISPIGGTFIDSVKVAITCGTADARIYYTLDGTDPSETSTQYTQPFYLKSNASLKVRGFKTLMQPSEIATAAFIVNTTVGIPAQSLPHRAIKQSIEEKIGKDEIEVICGNEGRNRILIAGLDGRTVSSASASGPSRFVFSRSRYPGGIYLLSVESAGKIISRKIVNR